jgi:TPR repeat protein
LHLTRARDLALREQWADAADAFAKAVLDTSDTEEYYEYAAALLLAGRDDDYRQVVTDLGELTERSGNPDDQYAAARAAILVPQSPVAPNQAVQWAQQAAEADPRAWRQHILGLALFRAGRLDEAAELLEQVRNESNWGPHLKDIGLCLIHLQRGDIDAARGYRSETQAWIDRTAEARAEGEGRVQPTDWLELQVLLREADARLNP